MALYEKLQKLANLARNWSSEEQKGPQMSHSLVENFRRSGGRIRLMLPSILRSDRMVDPKLIKSMLDKCSKSLWCFT